MCQGASRNEVDWYLRAKNSNPQKNAIANRCPRQLRLRSEVRTSGEHCFPVFECYWNALRSSRKQCAIFSPRGEFEPEFLSEKVATAKSLSRLLLRSATHSANPVRAHILLR